MPDGDHLVTRLRRRLSKLRPARSGSETVDIAACISPLRYDVVVRAHFFDFLAARRDLAAQDLVREAQDEPYFVWFEQIECARFFPELLVRREEMMNRFSGRVQGAMRLLRSFEDDGFDPRWPVTLMSVRESAVADSGAPAMGRLHIGDGCHRIALLLREGRGLEPPMYRIRATSQPVPDNTAVLRRHGLIGEPEYVRFLADAFPGAGDWGSMGDVGDMSTLVELRSLVAGGGAERLDLLNRVLRAQASR